VIYDKILVVEGPGIKLKTEGKNLGSVRTNHPKISQLTLAAIIQKEFPDTDVRIIDMKSANPSNETKVRDIPYGSKTIEVFKTGQDFAEIEKEIKDADAMICTGNFSQEAGVLGDLIEFAKMVNSRIKVFIGGSDAGVAIGNVNRQAYFYSRKADCVAPLGDGEIILPLLLRGSLMPKSLAGRILPDFDDVLNPALHLIDLSRSTEDHEGPLPDGVNPPLIYLETSRGCRQCCDNCATPFTKGKYRFMSQKRIEGLLKFYKDAGIRTLVLVEDNVLSRLDIPGGRQAVIEWFTHMRSEGFAWEFSNGIELGKLVPEGKIDEELIKILFGFDGLSGCYRVNMPLERVDIPAYRKLVPFETDKKLLASILTHHVPMLTVGIIIGCPRETKDSLADTERKLKEFTRLIGKQSAGKTQVYTCVFLHTPIPGTNDYRRFHEEGRLAFDIDEYPELYNFYTSVVNGDEFAYHEITKLRRDMALELNGEKAMEVWEKRGKYGWK